MCERSGYGEQAAKLNTSLQRQTTMLRHGRLRETQLLRAGLTNLLYYKKGTNAGSVRGNLEKPTQLARRAQGFDQILKLI